MRPARSRRSSWSDFGSGSACRSVAPGPVPRARSWSDRAGRCPRRLSVPSSGMTWMPSSYSRKAPASMPSAMSRRWKSGSQPAAICASSHTRECTPATGFQWNFTRLVSPLRVDHPERVDAEALHGPERARNSAVTHLPEHMMGGLGVQRHEIPERVVRRLRLRDLPVGLRLAGVDDVGELDAVLDEEHRDVVADQIEVALVGVELDRETPGVAHGIGGPARAEDGREPARRPGSSRPSCQEAGLGDRRGGAVGLENAVRRGAAGVHDPLRDALVIEVRDLLPQVEVLEK